MAQQQKILLYVMPIFLAVISFQFPLGILLYWVTTNFWQVGQQAIILREVKQQPAADKPVSSDDQPPRRSPGASSGKQKGQVPKPEPKKSTADGAADSDKSSPKPSANGKNSKPGGDGGSADMPNKNDNHLPKRRKRDED